MADIFSKKKRSEIMSRVRAKETGIEIIFRKALWNAGFRYRKNVRKYFGTPDIVLKKYKTVIFIDSCFWHGCKKHGTWPKTRKAFWKKKIERNMERDSEVTKHFRKEKWQVIRIWEHEIKKDLGKAFARVEKLLKIQ
jgi:DNA mismatch endonuclease (patch repair protein)